MTSENFRFARSCSGLLAKPSDLLFTALRSVDRCAKDSTRTQRTNNAASDHIIFTAAVEWCDYDAPVSGGEQLAYSLPKIGADKTEAGPPKDPKKDLQRGEWGSRAPWRALGLLLRLPAGARPRHARRRALRAGTCARRRLRGGRCAPLLSLSASPYLPYRRPPPQSRRTASKSPSSTFRGCRPGAGRAAPAERDSSHLHFLRLSQDRVPSSRDSSLLCRHYVDHC